MDATSDRSWGIPMQPLTPEDLLIRQTPVESTNWGPSVESDVGNSGPVPLLRFQELELTIRNNPINPDPYLELARIYLKDRRWHDAKRVLDRAFQQFSENDEVVSLREDAQLARSLELFNEYEAAYNSEPSILTQEPLQKSKIELNSLRERICRARLERYPDRVELHIPLALALENLGSIDEAIKCLRLAMATPSLRATAGLQLGYVYTRARRIPEALASFRRAALFRIPPAPPEIKKEALMAAADLAQRHHLIDSARRYVLLLTQMLPDDKALAERLEQLKAMPL